MRIAIAATCVADTLFPQAPIATVKLLERLGHQVFFPPTQTCCGQMHVNTGYLDKAVPVVENHVNTFAPVLDNEWDAIVIPSGSCAGSIKHQQAMVCERAGMPQLARTAAAVAERTFELSEFLVDVLGLHDVGAHFPYRVTYHPTCHSKRLLGVGDKPYQLLRAVADIDLVPLPQEDQCCGFGGTFAVKNSDTSTAMLNDKIESIQSTDATVVSAGDYSCLMHIGGGLNRRGSHTTTMHLAEILASTREDPAHPPKPARSSAAPLEQSLRGAQR